MISTTTTSKKQVANATGKWRTTKSLDQSLQTVTKTHAARGKKAKGADLKSSPFASLVSASSWRRGGAVAPGQLGSSASSHFKTSAGTKPVQQVQLKMTDLSPNPSAEQELGVVIAQLIQCCGLPFSMTSIKLFCRVIALAKAVPTTHSPPAEIRLQVPSCSCHLTSCRTCGSKISGRMMTCSSIATAWMVPQSRQFLPQMSWLLVRTIRELSWTSSTELST